MNNIDPILLKQMVDERMVKITPHKTADLEILNYTARAQYTQTWNSVTTQCRGLIRKISTGEIVARPFAKFFNFNEINPDKIPKCAFKVYEKLDGSLGILYWIGDQAFIATRGSFESDQAMHATQLLNEKYKHVITNLNKENTYLFEIIYPENRIVVDYHGKDDIILLAAFHTASGKELPIDDIPFPRVRLFSHLDDLSQILAMDNDKDEGFVIRFDNGLRAKVKFAEYKRLHRIVTDVSSYDIHEMLANKKDI